MHNRHHAKPATSAGFTLIEMAIVVALFGMLAGGGMVALGQFLDQIALKKTDGNLAKVEKALSLYVLQEGWLPCPDTAGTGVQNLTGTDACAVGATNSVLQGMIPYRDLGLQLDDVKDGWNRRLTYIVTYDLAGGRNLTSLAVATSLVCTNGIRKYTEVASLGEIEPLENPIGSLGTAEDWPTPNPPPRSAYAVISHGENGFGAFLSNGSQFQATGGNPDEDLNASHTNNVRGSAEITAGIAALDDIVHTRTPAQILYDMGCRNDGT